MKTKRILSFVCVLALAVSLCSGFAFAAAPEATEEEASTWAYADIDCKVTKSGGTHIYVSASTGSGYAYNGIIPQGKRMYIISTSSSGWYYYVRVTMGSSTYKGYVLTSDVQVLD